VEDNFLRQANKRNVELIVIGDRMWETLYKPEIYKRRYIGSIFSKGSLTPIINEHLGKESKKDDWNLFISKCF